MGSIWRLVPMLAGLLVMVVPSLSQAVPITVEIGNPPTQFLGNDTVTIPNGTYGGVIISGADGVNPARVWAGLALGNPDDANNDRLVFDNAKLQGAQINTVYTITYWGTFTTGPTGNYWYKIRGASNRFTRPQPPNPSAAALNSWVQAKGFIQHPIGSPWTQITTSQLVQTITNFNYTAVFSPTNTLSQQFTAMGASDRMLKGELKFRVAALDHALNLMDGSDGIQILYSTTPGPGDVCPDDSHCEYAPPIPTGIAEIAQTTQTCPAGQQCQPFTLWQVFIVMILFLVALIICCLKRRV